MPLAVLTYHSHNVFGTEYAGNDHVALASDLETLHRMGAAIVPLETIAERVASGRAAAAKLEVGLSFDDGPVFDFEDFVHPRFGPQRGFLNILRDFRERHGPAAQPGLHATSFVIASPEARRAMERSPGCGYDFLEDWLAESWWPGAVASGLLGIGNHSWDHVHNAVERTAVASPARGDFTVVGSFDDAEREIRDASEYINARLPSPCALFAYPFGHVNEYLLRDYLPRHGPSIGLRAAFGTSGRIDAQTSVWAIARWVCGHDWRSPVDLERLLGD